MGRYLREIARIYFEVLKNCRATLPPNIRAGASGLCLGEALRGYATKLREQNSLTLSIALLVD